MSDEEKRAIVDLYARRHHSVQIHVDTRVAGVELPAAVRALPEATLKVGHHQTSGQLLLGPAYLAQRLFFAGIAYRVRIPWGAVFAARTKTAGTYWERD